MVICEDGRGTVYDFGMNIAEDTEFFLAKGFTVVAIEANPQMCADVERRFEKEIVSGKLRVVNKAIGDKLGIFRFYVCEEMTAWSTASEDLKSYWEQKGAKFTPIDIEFVSASEVLQKNGDPYYIKIDIEGHDIMCMRQIAETTIRPPFLSFELDLQNYRESIGLCTSMGYTRFTIVDQQAVPASRLPAQSREGRSIDYQFRLGQTGPFGADILQDWVSTQAVLRQCRILKAQGKLLKILNLLTKPIGVTWDASFPKTQTWYDIHAGR